MPSPSADFQWCMTPVPTKCTWHKDVRTWHIETLANRLIQHMRATRSDQLARVVDRQTVQCVTCELHMSIMQYITNNHCRRCLGTTNQWENKIQCTCGNLRLEQMARIDNHAAHRAGVSGILEEFVSKSVAGVILDYNTSAFRFFVDPCIMQAEIYDAPRGMSDMYIPKNMQPHIRVGRSQPLIKCRIIDGIAELVS